MLMMMIGDHDSDCYDGADIDDNGDDGGDDDNDDQ